MNYAVVTKTPNNWAAYVPDLPGCIATGATHDEVERLIREAIRPPGPHAGMGEKIPPATTRVGSVDADE